MQGTVHVSGGESCMIKDPRTENGLVFLAFHWDSSTLGYAGCVVVAAIVVQGDMQLAL